MLTMYLCNWFNISLYLIILIGIQTSDLTERSLVTRIQKIPNIWRECGEDDTWVI